MNIGTTELPDGWNDEHRRVGFYSPSITTNGGMSLSSAPLYLLDRPNNSKLERELVAFL